ncbi:T9SS type A sorting domain-containing protein [Hymenobacter edaphi]|nr:T9SS type A sorting domain-containing protein [Hymenobacter edaphi]
MRRPLPYLLLLLGCLCVCRSAQSQQLDSIGITTNGTVQAVARDGNTLYVGGSFSQAGYQTGAAAFVDRTGGFPVASLPRLSGTVYCAEPDGAGGWYAGGSFSITSGTLTLRNLVHVRSNHALDLAFRPNPDGAVNTVAVDGTTVYVGGSFANAGGLARQNLAAVAAGTGLATNWNPGANSTVQALRLDGPRLHAGGSFTQAGGQPQRYYAQLDKASGAAAHTVGPNSTVQALALDGNTLYLGGSFSETGYFTGALGWLPGTTSIPDNTVPRLSGTVYCAEPDGAGGWYVGGSFSITSGTLTLRNLVHLTASRTLDAAFAPNPDGAVNTVAVDGTTVYVGGSFANAGGLARQNLAAVAAGTGLATNWNPGANSTVQALRLDGPRLHAGGSFTQAGGQPQRYYAQLDKASGAAAHTVGPNSTVQALALDGNTLYLGGSFSETGYFTGALGWLPGSTDTPANGLGRYTGTVYCAEPDGADGWYVGGSFTWSSGAQQWNNLVHVRADLTLDPAFVANPNGAVQTLLLDGSTLYAGGSFSNIGGLARQNLAAVAAGTGLAVATWSPTTNGTVHALALTGNSLYLAGSFSQLNGLAQRGLGALHKTTGASVTGVPELNSTGNTLLLDGTTLYVGGSFSQIGTVTRQFLATLNTGTNAVGSFNASVNSTVQCLALDGNTLYVGGSFSSIGGQQRTRLAAVDKTTALATAWNPAPNGAVETLVPDGTTIYAGGSFTQIGGQARRYAAGLGTAGTGTPTSWLPEPNGPVYLLARNGNGRLIGGSFSLLHSVGRSYAAALGAADGTVTSWNPGPNSTVTALATGGTSVYVGGSFSSIGGQQRTRLAAVDKTTALATAWNPAPNGAVETLALDGTTIYAGGSFTQIGGQARRYAAGLGTTGTGTPTSWLPEPNGPVQVLSRSTSETLIGGSFSLLHSVGRSYAAALGAADGTVTSWNPGPNSTVTALATGGTSVYVGGSFSSIGGQQRTRLAAVDKTTALATAWNPAPNGSIETLALDGTTIYAGGSFTQIGGLDRNYAAALSTAGTGTPTSWNPRASSTVHHLAATSSGVLMGGSFVFLKAENRSNLFAVDLVSGLVSGWDPAPNGRINTLLTTASAIFVGGSYSQIGGQPRSNLAALNKTSGAASTWNPGPNGEVAALLLSGTRVYVGGSFTQAGGQTRNNLAAVGTTGTGTALAWTPNPDGRVLKISESDNVVYICGNFTNVGGQARRSVAALASATGATLPWNPNPNGTVQDLHVTARQVYLAGSFTRIGTTNRQNVGVVSKTTGAVMPWNPGANGTINDIEVKNNFVFIGGSFTAAGGQTVRNFASLNANTGLNNDWYPSFNSTVQTIYIDNRSGVYMGGSFSIVDGQQTGPYVRYSFPRNYFRPRVDGITPNQGGNIGDVAVDVIGSGFADGTTLRLTRTGQPALVVPDSLVGVIDGIRLRTKVNLTGLAVGAWNVVVAVPGDTTMTLTNAFNVEAGRKAAPWADIMGFNAIRPGQWQTYTVAYGNNGNVNAVGVPLWVAVPANVSFESDVAVARPSSTGIPWDTVGTSFLTDSIHDEPTSARLMPLMIPVIRPGEVGTFTFKIRTSGTPATVPLQCQVWVGEPLYSSLSEAGSRGVAGVNAITNDHIDCFVGVATGIAGVVWSNTPGVGCAIGAMDFAYRGLVRTAITGDPGLTVGSISLDLINVVAGCLPAVNAIRTGRDVLKVIASGNYKRVGAGVGGSGYAGTIKSCYDAFNPPTPPVKHQTRVVVSMDPNDKLGSSGLGGSPYVSTRVPFRYLIRFENYATASAAAQEVRVIDTLDVTKLDPASLQLGYISFGNRRVEVPRGLRNFTADVDLRPGNDLIVRVVAALNETSGILSWTFTSLDPTTMRPTLDPLAGFLPPNVTAPEGEGGVFFTIMPRAGLTTHTAIRNKACIYFDNNAVICTPTWTNRVDNVAPASAVQALPAQQISRSFAVNWSGSDTGSGVADYTVYYSVNGRSYQPWLRNTRLTSAIFTGRVDSTYRFYSVARDTALNEEAAPAQPDATTHIGQLQVLAGLNDTICANAAAYQLTGFAPAGGTWSGRGVTAAGLVTPSALLPGDNELVYTVTVSGQTQVAAKTVRVKAVPATPQVLRVGLDSLRSSVVGASYEWQVNNVVLPVATRTIRITQAGTYTVRVRGTNQCFSARSTTLTVLSAARAQQQQAVRIYPNPASRHFVVTAEALNAAPTTLRRIQLLDDVGRLVYEQDVRQRGAVELPTPAQPGLYVVRVFTDKGVVVQKLTVVP